MYRYKVSESVKNDIHNLIGKPVFYQDTDGGFYIDDFKKDLAIQYWHAGTDSFKSETLDQICQELYTTDFAAQSTQEERASIDTVQLKEQDPDTGGVQFTPRYAPPGWTQQLFELEFETSVDGSVHEKDYLGNDIGWATLKFYKADGTECTDQADRDANCVRTDMEWMPNIDYMIKGGWVAQIDAPAVDIYVWAQAAVLPDAYGGPQSTFAEGGINMAYLGARSKTGLDGVAGTILLYDGAPGVLPPGTGTNKIRFVVRHPAGYKHRFQAIFDIFRE